MENEKGNWVRYRDIILNLDYVTEFSVQHDPEDDTYILLAWISGGIAYKPRLSLSLKAEKQYGAADFQVIEIQSGLGSKEFALELAEKLIGVKPRVVEL